MLGKREKKIWVDKNHGIWEYIFIFLFLLLFIYLNILIIKFNSISGWTTVLFGMEVSVYSICGMLTQAQVMILVCLVVFFQRKGHIVSMILCSILIVRHLTPALLKREPIISIIGLTTIIGAVVINIIIYQYGKRLNQQMRETKKQKEKMLNLAAIDSLTGLWNRRSVIGQLEKLTGKNSGIEFDIVFIDLDNFKKINDTLGHQYGDLLLKQVGDCWKSFLMPGDFLARLGGDEFALIINRNINNKEITEYVNEFKESLWSEIYIETRRMPMTASFGVSSYPKDGNTAENLLKYADTAMYMAKAAGKNRLEFFSEEMYKQMIKKLHMEEALDRAIEKKELYLMYQPQYTCHGKKLRGFEVLLRWKSEEWNVVSPAEFIPIAEESGKIIKIGKWVLETACREFKTIIEQNQATGMLSVNISAVQLLEPQFVNMVREVLEETAFNPKQLELEITESVFISSKEYVINRLNELKGLGIHIALDDFGTHYASLSYIQMLPLDVLKIDKSFIDQIKTSQNESIIIGQIISIAQQLKYEVIAEGIERDEQIEYLERMGCDFVQGFLWGEPLIKNDMADLIEALNKEAV